MGDTVLIWAAQNGHLEIVKSIQHIKELKTKNSLHVEQITNKITNVLVTEADWNNSQKIENEIITLLQDHELFFNKNFKYISLDIKRLLKKNLLIV